MPAATSSETWDAAWTLTDRVHKKRLTDNITDAYPTLDRFRKADIIEVENGGKEIQEDLMYGLNSLQWFSGYDEIDTDAVDGITSAFFTWAYGDVPVTVSMQEELEGRVSSAAMRITAAKQKQSRLTMLDGVNNALHSAQSGKAPLGLQDICSDSAATVGGISDSTNDWWANQRLDFNANYTSCVTKVEDRHQVFIAMNNIWKDVGEGNDQPNLIITSPHILAKIEEIFEGNAYGRYTIGAGAKPGVDGSNPTFKGVEIIADNDTVANAGLEDSMYLLNTDYLKFKIMKGMNFKKTPFREPTNQFAQVAYVVLACQLTTNNRRRQGLIHDMVAGT